MPRQERPLPILLLPQLPHLVRRREDVVEGPDGVDPTVFEDDHLIRPAERGQFAVIRRNGAIEAYAAIRPFGRGEVIGPVIAGSADEAKALISFFAAPRPGAFLRVDTGSVTGIADWLGEIGLAHVGGGVTMDRPSRTDAQQARPKVYALANQALG